MTRSVGVFLAASFGKRFSYTHAAKQFGQEVARRNYTLIYGGSRLGLMGVMADAALECGANVIGVITESLYETEGHSNLTKQHIVKSLFERKQLMHALSDGFIALPGGIGTYDEIFEILAAIRMGFRKKSFGILNIDGYYDKLLKLIDHCAQENFLPQEFLDTIPVHHNPEILLDAIFCSEISSITSEDLAI
jgi:uncharacterized protein (TIGR00730 family)